MECESGDQARKTLGDSIAREYASFRRMVAVLVYKSFPAAYDETLVEEVIQEAVLRAMGKAQEFNSALSAVPWLMCFANNILRSKRKSSIRRPRQVQGSQLADAVWESLLAVQDAPFEEEEEEETHRAKLKLAFGQLDPSAQRAIYHRFYEGRTGEELARALEVDTTAKARVRVSRAVTKLKRLFHAEARELVQPGRSEELP